MNIDLPASDLDGAHPFLAVKRDLHHVLPDWKHNVGWGIAVELSININVAVLGVDVMWTLAFSGLGSGGLRCATQGSANAASAATTEHLKR